MAAAFRLQVFSVYAMLVCFALSAATSSTVRAQTQGSERAFHSATAGGRSFVHAERVRGRYSPEEVAVMSASLDRLANLSRRGESAVAVRRALLRRMSSTTSIRNDDSFRIPPEAAQQCTTELFGVTYVDECTTDAEVEAVWEELDALQLELEGDKAEMEQVCLTVWEQPSQCVYDAEEESSSSASWSATSTAASFALESPDGATGGSVCLDSAVTESSSHAISPGRYDCINEAVLATGALVMFLTEKSTLKGKGKRIARAALSTAQGRLLASGFLVGFGFGTAIMCFMT